MKHGRLLVQVRDVPIEATLTNDGPRLMVAEDGDPLTAESWIVKRLARLPMLADRICDYDESPAQFVAPSGRLVKNQQAESRVNQRAYSSDIASQMTKALGTRTPGEDFGLVLDF